ncbi:MAG: hypothetical protein MUC96_08925 [Myxococcaceae bacterium]|jgi:hypothetical protein|nr:hypothetical protein [Myxococcaceae bacterium]
MADRELREALEQAQAELARLKREREALEASKAEAERRATAALNASRLEAESAARAAEAERRRASSLEDQLQAATAHLTLLEAECRLQQQAEAGEKVHDGPPATQPRPQAQGRVIIGPSDEDRQAPVTTDEFGPLSRAVFGLGGVALVIVDAVEFAKSGTFSGWIAPVGVVLVLLAIKLR